MSEKQRRRRKRKEKRRIIIRRVIIVFVILIVLVCIGVLGGHLTKGTNNQENMSETAESVISYSLSDNETAIESVDDSSEVPLSTEDDNLNESQAESGSTPFAMPGFAQTTDKNPGKVDTTDTTIVSFPYSVPGSKLIVQKIASYDGIYLEDGNDSEITNVASLVVKNNGSKDVEYAHITLECDGTIFNFEISDLPGGEKCVAQEMEKKSYKAGTYRNCVVEATDSEELDQSKGIIEVNENEDGSLTVKNVSNQDIPAVRVFYKFYMPEQKSYVGGITYVSKVEDLAANGETKIIPSHYVPGYSKVVMIRTYKSKE